MGFQRAFAIAGSGLSAQRARMEAVASNLANARTTRTPEGGPYRRLLPVFSSQPMARSFGDRLGQALQAVHVERIVEDPSPPLLKFEPGHPDEDADGFVAYPDVNSAEEMVDMLSAVRSYEAGVTVITSLRDMGRAALEILA